MNTKVQLPEWAIGTDVGYVAKKAIESFGSTRAALKGVEELVRRFPRASKAKQRSILLSVESHIRFLLVREDSEWKYKEDRRLRKQELAIRLLRSTIDDGIGSKDDDKLTNVIIGLIEGDGLATGEVVELAAQKLSTASMIEIARDECDRASAEAAEKNDWAEMNNAARKAELLTGLLKQLETR